MPMSRTPYTIWPFYTENGVVMQMPYHCSSGPWRYWKKRAVPMMPLLRIRSTIWRKHRSQGRFAGSEPLYMRSLAIREKMFGPEHYEIGRSLNNLAELYRFEGRYADAEPLYTRSLAILEKALGPEHHIVATQSKRSCRVIPTPRSVCGCRTPLYKVVDYSRKGGGF